MSFSERLLFPWSTTLVSEANEPSLPNALRPTDDDNKKLSGPPVCSTPQPFRRVKMTILDLSLVSMSDAVISKEHEDGKAYFSDLPKEIRNMIYALSRPFFMVMVANAPTLVHRTSISKVCKAMRTESLDVFYGKTR